jgi:hypothetical protein
MRLRTQLLQNSVAVCLFLFVFFVVSRLRLFLEKKFLKKLFFSKKFREIREKLIQIQIRGILILLVF